MDLQIRADWTANSTYHIDFASGSITHSRAASRGQTNRIFKEMSLAGSLKHLTYFQAANFYKKNRTAELYLQYLRAMYHLYQLGRSTRSRGSPIKPPPPTSGTTGESSSEQSTP